MSEDQKPIPQRQQSSLGIPIAIVIAAALIAGAIMFSSTQKNAPAPTDTEKNLPEQQTPEVEVAPVTERDHIQGNPNAPIVIVEYSDYDCPFCKNFHETMNKIMAEYGSNGKVAWVYRHFPLQQLHPNAPKIAEASECVANLAGNDAFWKFSDLIFGERSTNEQTNILNLPKFAEQAGVDKGAFTTCLDSGTYTQQIADATEEALKTGARGTPYSFIIAGGQQAVINGAQPYQNVKQTLDAIVMQLEGGSGSNQ
ncbi:MAG TPA: thioredoxin domain-containing protein [Candidatus Paceibacterota bacterium]|nr:thioredoxin domain-containing protein [Candidatus Paceibacterota bacterium]